MAIGTFRTSLSNRVSFGPVFPALFGALFAHLMVVLMISHSVTSHHSYIFDAAAYIARAEQSKFYEGLLFRLGLVSYSPARTAIPPQSLEALTERISLETSANYSLNRSRFATAKGGEALLDLLGGVITSTEERERVRALMVLHSISDVRFSRGDRISYQLNEDGETETFSFRNKKNQRITFDRNSGSWGLSITADKRAREERLIGGTIRSSLIDTARDAGIPIELVDDIVDHFGERMDFRRDLQPGDTFTALFSQERSEDGSWLGAPELLAASIKNKGVLKAVVRVKSPQGDFVTFDETGSSVGQYFLRYPVQFSRISSVFSDSRLHPVLKVRRPHNGVDFAAPVGTPVRTVGDGVIEAAGYFGDAGNMVKIRHDKTYTTAYLHLHKIAPGIRKGAKVRRGDFIGTVGNTGLSSGPHLHFSLYINGRYVDPMKAQLPRMAPHSDERAAAFVRVTLQRMKSQHEAIVIAQTSPTQKRG